MASESYQNKNETIGKGKIGGLEKKLIEQGYDPKIIEGLKELDKNGRLNYANALGVLYKCNPNYSE